MGWQVLGVDLNRSESAGTPLACGRLGLRGGYQRRRKKEIAP
jgi:hypothetical protein